MHGGPSARPFVTHMNAFDIELVPAHRPRAVPQARRGRRHRAGLRDQPQLPQRGRRLHALAPSSRCSRPTRHTATTTPWRPHPRADPGRRRRGLRLARRSTARRHGPSTTWAASGRRSHVRRAVRGGSASRDHARRPRSSELRRSAAAAGSRPTRRGCHGKFVEELWEHLVGTGLHRPDVRTRLPRGHLAAGARAPLDARASWRSGTSTSRVRARAPATPSSSTRSCSASGSSSRRSSRPAATPRRCSSTRTSCGRWSTACRPRAASGMGIDRLLMALTGARHPRDDPLPAGEAGMSHGERPTRPTVRPS